MGPLERPLEAEHNDEQNVGCHEACQGELVLVVPCNAAAANDAEADDKKHWDRIHQVIDDVACVPCQGGQASGLTEGRP